MGLKTLPFRDAGCYGSKTFLVFLKLFENGNKYVIRFDCKKLLIVGWVANDRALLLDKVKLIVTVLPTYKDFGKIKLIMVECYETKLL